MLTFLLKRKSKNFVREAFLGAFFFSREIEKASKKRK